MLAGPTQEQVLLLSGFGANTYALDFELDSSEGLVITNADQTGLNLTGDHTVEFWVRYESLAFESLATFVSKWGGTGDESYLYNYRHTITPTRRYEAHCFGGGAQDFVFWNVSAPTTGQWYHVAYTCDISQAVADQWKLYIDGVDQGASTVSADGGVSAIQDGASPVSVAFWRFTSDLYYLDGMLDELRVWDVIRTGSEIADNRSAQIDPTTAGLVAYLRMNTGTGTIAVDSHANGNDMAFVATPEWVNTPLPF